MARSDPHFVLNQPHYQGATHPARAQELRLRLLARARAVGAAGLRLPRVIAPSFADIFFNNSFKNGFLPIVLREDEVDQLFYEAAAFPGFRLAVDLRAADGRDRRRRAVASASTSTRSASTAC